MFYPSVDSYGRSGAFAVDVARGLVAGHRSVVVFGFAPDVDTTEATVWPHTGLMAHPSTAIALKVSSTNANDTANGSGAQTVRIDGLNSNFDEVSETVSLNGQTEVLTTQTFLRINYATVLTAGASNGAEGDIYLGTGTVTAGVPATVYNLIKYNYNNTITGHYTIPAGYTGYVMQGLFSAGQPGGSAQVQGRLMVSGVDSIRRTAAVTTVNNGVADYQFEFPIPVAEKFDIEATALGSSNNNSASAMFIILLVKGLYPPGYGNPRS
jgi:hypothetical protein